MGLFQRHNFVSHSGLLLSWKIECDALSGDDIETLAYLIGKSFQFSGVVGIPRGGLKLAEALKEYAGTGENMLTVDDVLTTGGSMEEMRQKIEQKCFGVVLFARGECPDWITPLFQIHPAIIS